MLSLASGEKVKDDPKLLKKTLKREQKQKEKSGREWVDRKHTVQKGIQDRQKKRQDNLQARKDSKKAGKNGKKRPGFEGKSNGKLKAKK